jgi:hypothetical protein
LVPPSCDAANCVVSLGEQLLDGLYRALFLRLSLAMAFVGSILYLLLYTLINAYYSSSSKALSSSCV